jgi:hypothetical protein
VKILPNDGPDPANFLSLQAALAGLDEWIAELRRRTEAFTIQAATLPADQALYGFVLGVREHAGAVALLVRDAELSHASQPNACGV